jgi:hypothetical protein
VEETKDKRRHLRIRLKAKPALEPGYQGLCRPQTVR